MLEPLRAQEVAMTITLVIAVYGGAMCAMHFQASALVDVHDTETGYWGTLPSAWDHPEPNYVVSPAIGEFWSVMTTIPVAGALLLYQGLRYQYNCKVLCIYVLTCAMYSLAFAAHLTLEYRVFSTTVIAVMSNALLTFAEFSYIVHRVLHSKALRTLVVVVAEAALVGAVATMPYALKANGGVWTLFTVQTPGVFLATGLAAAMTTRADGSVERTVYCIVLKAGCLLSAAMTLSLAECLVGFEYGFINSLWGFPWLHIAIHVLEQVGIYLFGVGVAALDTLLLDPAARPRAEVRHVGQWLVYLYYPGPVGEADACGTVSSAKLIPLAPSAAAAPAARIEKVEVNSSQGGERKMEADHVSTRCMSARHRLKSPGARGGLSQ
mmetsp:Transcript_33002/g.64974  ORF Transcript_33002/g.64974 Transcript_33002/m.64974 type:complete len:380 (+) Transcript_33002:3-1142(+)